MALSRILGGGGQQDLAERRPLILLLQWLGTRRGLAVFVLLLLVTVFSNLCRFSQRSHTEAKKAPIKMKTCTSAGNSRFQSRSA